MADRGDLGPKGICILIKSGDNGHLFGIHAVGIQPCIPCRSHAVILYNHIAARRKGHVQAGEGIDGKGIMGCAQMLPKKTKLLLELFPCNADFLPDNGG